MRENGAIDQISVAHEISSTEEGALEQVGGAEYLAQLVLNVPTSFHIEHYANIVRDSSVLRHVIRAGGQIAELGYDGGPEVEPVLDRAEEVVFGIPQRAERQGLHPHPPVPRQLHGGGRCAARPIEGLLRPGSDRVPQP